MTNGGTVHYGSSDQNEDVYNLDICPIDDSNFARSTGKWSSEEDDRLKQAVLKYGESKWKKIAEIVETRDHVQCLQRWKKILKPGIVKGAWSKEEDQLLVMLISQEFSNWGHLSRQMPGRTAKQCRERWFHYLDPSIRHTPFTAEEDELILKIQSEIGNKWAKIAENLPGRSANSIKTRYLALCKCLEKGQESRSIRCRRK